MCSTQATLHEIFPLELLAARRAQVSAFWAGEIRALASCTSSHRSYRQLGEVAAMAACIRENLSHQATLPGCNLPCIHADFGTVSTARHWGGRIRLGAEGKPHIEPVAEDPEAILALTPRPVAAPDQDAARGLALLDAARAQLDDHAGELWLRSPDMQGTLNTAALICEQTSFMLAMHDRPDLVHRLLDRVCEVLISYQDHLRSAVPGRLAGNIWPWTVLPPGSGVALTEDYMPLLGVDGYRDFGIPYLARLAHRYGGVQIHCCGRWGRHVPTLLASGIRIRAVEFHHPFTTLAEVLPLAEAGAALVPFFNDRDQPGADPWHFYQELLRTAPPWARFWFAFGDEPGAQDFVRRVSPG